MSDVLRMQVLGYCESVRTGSKPVAMISIQSRYEKEIREVVEAEGIKIYLKDVKGDDNWKVAWLYKHEYLLDVINQAPEHPNSKFDHWLLGKLFGYSDEAINSFLLEYGTCGVEK